MNYKVQRDNREEVTTLRIHNKDGKMKIINDEEIIPLRSHFYENSEIISSNMSCNISKRKNVFDMSLVFKNSRKK